jgi:hypothetical protein
MSLHTTLGEEAKCLSSVRAFPCPEDLNFHSVCHLT